MSSRFKAGPGAGSLTSLDGLATPVPDPQAEYRKHSVKTRLGDGSLRGRGFTRVIWEFPMLEIAEQEQLITTLSTATHIQSPDENEDDTVFEVTVNFPDPRESGDHRAGFNGFRAGLLVEFIVLAEVP